MAWAGVIIAWPVIGLVALVGVAGMAASAMSGHGWSGPVLDVEFGIGLVRAPLGPGKYWPDVSALLIGVVLGSLIGVPALIGWRVFIAWQARSSTTLGLKGLARA